MVIDTSAILAILQEEPEAAGFARVIALDARRLMSSVNALEAASVIEARRGTLGKTDFDNLVTKARIEIVAFSDEDVAEAHEAFRAYGKGRHAAGLNFCDCVAYALSKRSGEALRFKGDDLRSTDVARVVLERA